MRKINTGGHAFPGSYIPSASPPSDGMSKRELIATHALAGLLAYMGDGPPVATIEEQQAHFAKVSVGYADALLRELDQ
ncbi:MAG TPA: hypothetical protein VHP34_11330 [Alphaproteobacteria bacterium]|nr:hypothetical protein [Alphaproteobacteria bacterium]